MLVMVKIKDGQTLFDMAIEHYGTWEAALAIALVNGIAITDAPEDGTQMKLPTVVHDVRLERYCKQNSISPATLHNLPGVVIVQEEEGIFTAEFSEQFM